MMSPICNRLTALVYLAAMTLTSMPVYVGLLGWCPCGCVPEALVYPEADDSDPTQPQSPGEHHHHDSQHCRGCNLTSYCPVVVELPFAEWADAGLIAAEPEQQLPPHHVAPLLRPPRAGSVLSIPL
jgi:hypothetical protein